MVYLQAFSSPGLPCHSTDQKHNAGCRWPAMHLASPQCLRRGAVEFACSSTIFDNALCDGCDVCDVHRPGWEERGARQGIGGPHALNRRHRQQQDLRNTSSSGFRGTWRSLQTHGKIGKHLYDPFCSLSAMMTPRCILAHSGQQCCLLLPKHWTINLLFWFQKGH